MESNENVQESSEQLDSQIEEVVDSTVVTDFSMVTFSLAEKDYAVDIMNVKEIAKAGNFTYVPNTLPFVLGVHNLRGDIIPIIDLRLFFSIPVEKTANGKLENLLILTIDNQTFGVVVDRIDKVIGIQKNTIRPPHPLFGDINIKYIYGVVEANKRLYVLLDIARIFTSKGAVEEAQAMQQTAQIQQMRAAMSAPAKAPEEPAPKKVEQPAAAPQEKKAQPTIAEAGVSEQDLKFIVEGLMNYKKFAVSSLNEAWIKHRAEEWQKSGKKLIQNETDAEEFLKPYWSAFSGTWWSKEFADSVYALLPENNAKQIVVWNPGCGKGCETYSLACLLARRYPVAKIRIYAQDVDLLTVSNASLLSVPDNLSGDWYGPYLSKKTSGDYTFNQGIKDSIMFEYHDCKNTNALPMVDIVFARDVLSLLDKDSQNVVIADFFEKMKGNAIAIVGENERLPANFGFGENTVGTLTAYTKE